MSAWTNYRRLFRFLHVAARHVLSLAFNRCLPSWTKVAHICFGSPLSPEDRFKRFIEEMGGTFIKFGQMLALQSDMVPLTYCRALFSLFDDLAPFSYADVEKTFREDLHRTPADLFERFDVQPIAAGSIGQVHSAMLGRQKVAVKVRRPTIRDDFGADVVVLKSIVGLIKLFRIRALYWIVAPTEEFVAWTREELDFTREAHYMEELRRNARNNPSEKVPAVFWSCTTARILTVEFLDGVTISEYLRNEAERQSLVPAGFDANAVAAHLVDNFLGDAFRNGMFHADLHPGNLMIMAGNTIGYVDFGISGILSRYSRRHLISMTLSYARGDLDGMCESFFRITTRDENANMHHFRKRLQEVSSTWYESSAERSRLCKSITSMMLDLLVLSRECGIWPQRDVIKYIRSAITLDGLLKTFNPGMDIGRQLEITCTRHLKWDSMHTLMSQDALIGWLDSSANLLRDGAVRAAAWLRQAGTRSAARRALAIKSRAVPDKKPPPALQLLCFAACITLVLRRSEPVLTTHGFWWVASVAVGLISWTLGREHRRRGGR